MCGIAGFLCAREIDAREGVEHAARMGAALSHRGPDGNGEWCDPQAGIALAHRRLAVLDLSSAGDQPMTSTSGRYVMVYNGEIYNHLDLRKEIAGGSWRGHSDTETLLACVEEWGFETALRRTVGMFAIAIWDRAERVLLLARDRMGEKPLYYGWQKNVFFFASELQALRAHPYFEARVDRGSLTLFFRYGYVPSPRSIYADIRKLQPGSFLKVDVSRPECAPATFWTIVAAVHKGRGAESFLREESARTELESLLGRAIAGQMVADVPVGAFLSGGIDSSTVAALMQRSSGVPVRTFTIGFDESGYDEAAHAAAVARHLGTDHTELYVTPSEAMGAIRELPHVYTEPFADSSQIPLVLVSQLARRRVTVSLSGDGGDEIFGGYNRHVWADRIWRRLEAWPLFARKILGAALLMVPQRRWDTLVGVFARVLPRVLGQQRPGEKLHKIAELLTVRDVNDLYLGLVSHWRQPSDVVLGGVEPQAEVVGDPSDLASLSPEERMMLLDAITYLPDDILTKLDRASMSVSLETRVPLLDHRIVEFAWGLPVSMKISDGHGKRLLRSVLERHVPRALFDRPKSGFAVPIDVWLRGPLRSWAEELLDARRLAAEGFLSPQRIRSTWGAYAQGRDSYSARLWNVLMFQAWLESSSRVSSLPRN